MRSQRRVGDWRVRSALVDDASSSPFTLASVGGSERRGPGGGDQQTDRDRPSVPKYPARRAGRPADWAAPSQSSAQYSGPESAPSHSHTHSHTHAKGGHGQDRTGIARLANSSTGLVCPDPTLPVGGEGEGESPPTRPLPQ